MIKLNRSPVDRRDMLDAAANAERTELLSELTRKQRLFVGLGLLAAAITVAGLLHGTRIAVGLGILGMVVNVRRVQRLGPYKLLLSEMAPEREAARRAERLSGTGPIPDTAPVAPPAPEDIATLREHGLDWPLQLIERVSDPDEEDDVITFGVSFDDVAAHDFEAEIDDLAEHLDGLDGVRHAWREDREFILVETAGPVEEQRRRLDAHASSFLRKAIAGCGQRPWPAS